MYRVLCDGLPIHDLRDEELVLLDPQLNLEVNTAGSFSFKLPPGHPQYDLPKKMRSCIEVWHDDEQIFAGRPTVDKLDFYNRKNIECEGQLAFLNDSIQRPAEYHNMTVRGYLEALIAIHNSQVDESKQFEVGIVTVTDSNDSLYRYTNYNSTWTEIKEDLVDDLGGYIRVRNHNGHRYIDYIAEFDNLCSQSIVFGENLLDCAREVDMTEIATAVIPLGARLEESGIAALEERLTIKSVNDDRDYIVNEEAAEKYGFIVKTVIWDDVTTPERLLSKGKKWLTEEQFESMVIDVKAVDLHYTDVQIEQFKLYDIVPVYSKPHGLDRKFPLSKMTIHLDKPSSNTLQLGMKVKTSLTSKTSDAQSAFQKVIETIPVPSDIVKQAVNQATALITAATHGHVVTTANEQLIMDTADVNTATKVWRWNLNGLGYSNTGYSGEYSTAITMDGQFVGERITANSISGDKLDITYRMSVTKEIADAGEAVKTDAKEYTDEQLKSYYTKGEIETTIRNLEDSVLLSAKETSEQYVDGRLQNYSTTAQIKVTTDAISSEVSRKLNSADLATQIEQNATAVKIAWNNISKFIQFEDGELRIYDSDGTDQQLISKFNYSGSHFYYDGQYVGQIGTDDFGENYTGLVFNLEYRSKFMAWCAEQSADASQYYTLLTWDRDDAQMRLPGFHFYDKLYVWNSLRFNQDAGVLNFGTAIRLYSEEYVDIGAEHYPCCRISGEEFSVLQDKTVNFYSQLNLNGYGWTNDSDARLKNNIKDTAIDGLATINSIELKEFDWMQTGIHQDIGIIAQQILDFAPELVEEAPDGHLRLKTNNLVYYCIKAIQELCDKLGIEKPEVNAWNDPYAYLDKKAFCVKLSSGKNDDKTPVAPEPLIINPKKNGVVK